MLIEILTTLIINNSINIIDSFNNNYNLIVNERKEINNLKKELKIINKKQQKNLKKIIQDKNLDNEKRVVLAAIAWQETGFGLKVKNSKDGTHGSFCMYQIQSAVAGKRFGLSPNEAKNKLLQDYNFCKKAALAELSFWEKRKDANYENVFARYNAGYKGLNNPAGKKYSENVILKIKTLKIYLKENGMAY